jgi:hypothetical protein
VDWFGKLYDAEQCATGINVMWLIRNNYGSALWSGHEIAAGINASIDGSTSRLPASLPFCSASMSSCTD